MKHLLRLSVFVCLMCLFFSSLSYAWWFRNTAYSQKYGISKRQSTQPAKVQLADVWSHGNRGWLYGTRWNGCYTYPASNQKVDMQVQFESDSKKALTAIIRETTRYKSGQVSPQDYLAYNFYTHNVNKASRSGDIGFSKKIIGGNANFSQYIVQYKGRFISFDYIEGTLGVKGIWNSTFYLKRYTHGGVMADDYRSKQDAGGTVGLPSSQGKKLAPDSQIDINKRKTAPKIEPVPDPYIHRKSSKSPPA